MKQGLFRLILVSVFSVSAVFVQAQEEEATSSGGFKKENLFTGGNLNLGFFNGSTMLGLTPHFGYSIAKWLDVAVSLNYTYITQRDAFDNRLRQTNIGPGAFMRIFPIENIYVQGKYEHNFIRLKGLPAGGGSRIIRDDVGSFLVGAGYTSGRYAGNNTYYYFGVLFDVLKNPNSPYTDNAGRIVPVMNAGFNIGLFQGRRGGMGGGRFR